MLLTSITNYSASHLLYITVFFIFARIYHGPSVQFDEFGAGGAKDSAVLPQNHITFPSGKIAESYLLYNAALRDFRRRPPFVQFNAELALLPASSRNPGGASSRQNLTSAFNANAEALGDLFMREFHLQSNLDLDEITAVAGFVSKEDLDVQRLVDVLWRQDVDLGIGRETYEYSIVQQAKTSAPAKAEKIEPYLVPNLYNPQEPTYSRSTFRGLDDETGEPLTRTASGNDTYDPNSNQVPNTTFDADVAQFGLDVATTSVNLTQQQIEAQELQDLIETLERFDAAASSQNQEPQPIPTWQNSQIPGFQQVPSLENHQVASSNVPSSITQPSAFGGHFSGMPSTSQPSIDPMQANASSMIKSFDLFSMFMGPPTNWTLPTAPPALGNELNSTGGFGFANAGNQGAGASTSQSLNGGVDYYDSQSGFSGASSLTDPPYINQDGLFDFPGFPYSQSTLHPREEQPNQSLSSQRLNSATNSPDHYFDWDLSSWSNNGLDLLAGPSETARKTGGFNNSDWLKLEDLTPIRTPGSATDSLLSSLEDTKFDLAELDLMSEPSGVDVDLQPPADIVIKMEEDLDDPWSLHVGYAAAHNHTYAASGPRGWDTLLDSRERSEDRRSVTDSTGSGSNGRSRHSRDEWAASEMQLPVTAEEIVNMPVEEFNSYISGTKGNMNTNQIQLMKDIRRRGKNKVAAQNCRRRKIEGMSHLEREIMRLREELQAATARRDQLAMERERYRMMLRANNPPSMTSPGEAVPECPSPSTSSSSSGSHNPNEKANKKRKRED